MERQRWDTMGGQRGHTQHPTGENWRQDIRQPQSPGATKRTAEWGRLDDMMARSRPHMPQQTYPIWKPPLFQWGVEADNLMKPL